MASRREQMQEHIESPEWTESGLENVFRFYPGLLLQRGGIIQQTETTALPPCNWCINWPTPSEGERTTRRKSKRGRML